MLQKVLFIAVFSLCFQTLRAQRFLTDMMDTTTAIGKGIYPIYGEHDRLRFGGYMQPQFQYAESKGAKSFSGGDFSPNANNRFMLRRGRIRIDYLHNNEQGKPLAYFAFQFDGNEKGVNIRDFWGRFFENKLEVFAVTTGMFARPMGFEVNYSSSDRETPERGRMSQTLMKTERDLGVMLTFDARKKEHLLRWMKFDVGVFNGQGLAGPAEYDSHKDIIGRLSLKPRKVSKGGIKLSASVSGYYGGITSLSSWIYTADNSTGVYKMTGDSTASNIGKVTPRQYIGADCQIKIPNRKGFTELRAEYIRGLQTATASSSETPGSYPITSSASVIQPLYTRTFDGAYFYLLQHLGTDKHLAVVKFDWYDPNKVVKGKDVTTANGFSAADIRFNTLGVGYMGYINTHVKLFVYYDWVMNEETSIAGYAGDALDNLITCRVQYRF
ncbi:MAG: porin [Taibaiella sp.]|nr:porin [Taibaiella sp.]